MPSKPQTLVFNIALGFIFVNLAIQECYKMQYLSIKTIDTHDYGLSITLTNNSTLTAITTIRKEIKSPMWRFIVIERGINNGNQKIHYNGVVKSCDLMNIIKRIRFLRELAMPFFNDRQRSNISLECPLRVGVYVLRGASIPAKVGGVLKLLYAPNSIYTINFKVFQPLKLNKMEHLCTLELNVTINKNKC